MRRDLDERTLSLGEMRDREVARERELQELYAQVIQKDNILSDCEKRLVRNLKDKEHELATLKTRLDTLEHDRREALQKIDFLERLNEDKNAELTRVRQANDFKRT